MESFISFTFLSMKTLEKYSDLANEASIKKTIEALVSNGIHAFLVNNKDEARGKIVELIPHHSEIMTMTSVTLEETGINSLIKESPEFISMREKLTKGGMEEMEKRRLWAAHEWVIGSVHAVTEDGQVMIASATGSQLPSYAYGASNVIWVIGTQKIVKDLDEAMKRLYEYVFPLENERAMKAYGMKSWVNKILLINKEVTPGRIHIIFVQEKLGF